MTDDELLESYRAARAEHAADYAAMKDTSEHRRYLDSYARGVFLEVQMWRRGMFLEDIPREENT